MRFDALDTCNACDAIGVDPDSLAGYCTACERKARRVKCTTGRCKNRTTFTTNPSGVCDRHPKGITP